MALTKQKIARYREKNCLFPLRAMDSATAARYRADLEAYEASEGGAPLPPSAYRKTHVLLPWAAELVREPAIVDVIEDLLGPDVLVFTSTFFIKEANSPAITAWHQDSTYFGLRPHEHVTAWLALSESTVASGCMEVVPGSSAFGQLPHDQQGVSNAINQAGHAIATPVDEREVSRIELSPGEFSLHHTRAVHRSMPNRTDDRRIGIGISYIPTRCRHVGSSRMTATLVRGTDRDGNFDLEPDPRGLSPNAARHAHASAYGRYREGHAEQMKRHRAEFAPTA